MSFLTACREWATEEGTQRSAKIEIDGKRPEVVRAWVYDYTLQYGKFITSADQLPTTEQMKAAKRAELLRQLEEAE